LTVEAGFARWRRRRRGRKRRRGRRRKQSLRQGRGFDYRSFVLIFR
jgi:hypothetical protein